MSAVPAYKPARGAVHHEEAILGRVREHLREAAARDSVGELVFRFKLGLGGQPRSSKITVVVEYNYLENVNAI